MIDKLDKWADLLLDTGKRNNLINFRDTKMSSLEIVSPGFYSLFSRAEHSAAFEVYDPKLDEEDEEEEEMEEETEGEVEEGTEKVENEIQEEKEKQISKEEYLEKYEHRLRKQSQVLVYNAFSNPIKVLHNIGNKAVSAIDETGVNIAHMAFGFINWTEDENSRYVMHAPILLVPISIINDSAADPYYIKVTDSDIVVNPTFAFKLKNDYGIDLPEYDDENIEEYFEKVEERISKLNWTITRECKVGTFSFLKINMYKDLKNNSDKILKNRNVRSLLGGNNSAPLSEDGAVRSSSDGAPLQLHNVVDSDSSQTEAIEMARSGKSFVLQGPPGTGKSQTITNIIAECLASGKKVLFVSEKLAALNVVYDKLKKVGLEEFCLELHSHKANKKDVIDELCRTLKKQKSSLSERAQREIEEKIRAQEQLNQYAVELHKVRPIINKTLYKIYEEISVCRNAPDLDFVIDDIKTKNEKYITWAENALTRYVEYIPSIGYDYRKNPWYGYSDLDYSYQSVANLKHNLKDAVSFCENIKELNAVIDQKYSISAKNIYHAYVLRDFFNLIKTSKFITPGLFAPSALDAVIETASYISVIANKIRDARKIIDEIFDNDIYKIDGRKFYKKLSKQHNGFFSRLFSGEYKHMIKEIMLCKKNSEKIKYKDAVSAMEALSIYQQGFEDFGVSEEKITALIGIGYNGIATDFENLLSDLNALAKILSSSIAFNSFADLSRESFITNQRDFSNISDRFKKLFDSFEKAEQNVYSKFNLQECDPRLIELDLSLSKYSSCYESIDQLDTWCQFAKALHRLDELGIREFVDLAIGKNVEGKNILPAYKKVFYTQWADAILHESDVLASMSRIPHDDTVNLFKTKDTLVFEINKAKIKSRLSAERPNLDMVAQGSAISILVREGEKKRKQKSVRNLLESITELVQTLKPCFLMSPLSVSTFLSPNTKFDVVVFDEASQIFPQDAIGAVYRGQQLIVVGDSKQMPPTNFFGSSNMDSYNGDDDEAEDITDFESILDICSTAFPQKRLKWHYRSRYEQLISFSNKNFYENDLITFPSSKKDAPGIGVDYIYVDGVFDRKSKTNRAEAERIVDLVFENIENHPERSLGVVAFSVSQQSLIDKLILKRRQQDLSKETFFKSNKPEPFFVKNLETVQGDERDTIIFSIAYGKDSQGRLLLNFGPINRQGGERRLNVAVTRAKHNVQVVSSMHYTDIDLSRTQSVGARLLREYLDYAENGEIALKRTVSVSPFEEYDSEFEMEVCDFLREKGFSVDTQVGCSSFKIDLALKHPNSSDYVLAIECDGAAYHSSKSARDRDRLRQEILEGMGWKFYRIWSTDWFRNKNIEKDLLLKAANAAIENSDIKIEHKRKNTDIDTFEEIAEDEHFEFPKYEMVDAKSTAIKCDMDVLKTVRAIAEVEAPLSEEWLLKRIAFLYDREKVTNVVREEFGYDMLGCKKIGIIRKKGFIYLQDREIPMLRTPKENASTLREIKHISLEELALGMKEILKRNISVEKDGLFHLLIKELGFNRMGEAIQDRLKSALRLISKEIEVNENMLSLK